MVDGPDSAWRNRAPGPHRNTARQAMDGLRTEVCGQQTQSNEPRNNQHNPQYANYWAPLTPKRHIPPHPVQPRHTDHWLRERGNDTSKSTGHSGRQNAAPRRNMRREDRVTVRSPVKEQQPDGMPHRGASHRRTDYQAMVQTHMTDVRRAFRRAIRRAHGDAPDPRGKRRGCD